MKLRGDWKQLALPLGVPVDATLQYCGYLSLVGINRSCLIDMERGRLPEYTPYHYRFTVREGGGNRTFHVASDEMIDKELFDHMVKIYTLEDRLLIQDAETGRLYE